MLSKPQHIVVDYHHYKSKRDHDNGSSNAKQSIDNETKTISLGEINTVETVIDTSIDNVYGEPQPDRFDEIIDLLKQGNIYGETKDITLGAVEVPIEKQISIDKASTKGLKSEVYINKSESKVDKLRKLRSGN